MYLHIYKPTYTKSSKNPYIVHIWNTTFDVKVSHLGVFVLIFQALSVPDIPQSCISFFARLYPNRYNRPLLFIVDRFHRASPFHQHVVGTRRLTMRANSRGKTAEGRQVGTQTKQIANLPTGLN